MRREVAPSLIRLSHIALLGRESSANHCWLVFVHSLSMRAPFFHIRDCSTALHRYLIAVDLQWVQNPSGPSASRIVSIQAIPVSGLYWIYHLLSYYISGANICKYRNGIFASDH